MIKMETPLSLYLPYLQAIGLVLLTMLLSACGGCQHFIVDGGSSQHEQRGYSATVDPETGKITVTDTRDHYATSQPTADGFGATPKIGASGGDGEIGSISFTQLKPPSTGNIVLGVICLLVAGLSYYFLRNLMVAGVALAVGILAFVAPMMLAMIAVGGLIIVVGICCGFSWKRLIGSMSFGLEKLDSSTQNLVKSAMEQKQSPSDVKAIKALRPAVK